MLYRGVGRLAHNAVVRINELLSPRRLDVLLLPILAAAAAIELLAMPASAESGYRQEQDVWTFLAAAVVLAPFAFRHQRPVLVMAVSGIAYMVRLAAGHEPVGALDIAQLILIYEVGASVERPLANQARVIGGVAFTVGCVLLFAFDRIPAAQAGLMVPTWIAAAVVGESVYIRRRYQESLAERARQLERERDEQAQRAVMDERARIAREFHDIWAHTLSSVVVQAGAAHEVFDKEPEFARQALASIRDAGRTALNEVRRLIAVETEGGGQRVPAQGIDDLEGLVEGMKRVGLPATLTVSGDTSRLPQDVGFHAYRLVQQALTNVLTHAGPGAEASVTIEARPDCLSVDVTDNGRGPKPAVDGERQGRGLVGMRERVALYGGNFEAGPAPGGGFAVRATFPMERKP